jgi:hypothetical protein
MSIRASINKVTLAFFGFALIVGVPLGIWGFTRDHAKMAEESSVRQMDTIFQPTYAELIRSLSGSEYDFWMVSGAEPLWWPVNIRTDGVKTYIQFKDKEAIGFTDNGSTGQTPNILVVKTVAGNAESWTYRIIDNVMVVDAVIKRALLIGPDSKDVVAIRFNSKVKVDQQ